MKVYLPKTKFSLHSDAKKVEERILQFWQEIDLEKLRKEKNKNNKRFVLHDGPPYANGSLHMGHAQNKFWKDCLNKFFWQNGYDVQCKLGWDAHGLPIENAVEKQLKEEGIDKRTLSRFDFWDKCYDFASYWMNKQKEQTKQMAVFADYENVYATFFEKESLGIIECIHQFVQADLLEQRFRPTLWSYVEKTALAYAEVEYKDKVSESIFVKFPVIKTDIPNLVDANLIVWTTTPWTLPANETVAYNSEFDYIIVEHEGEKYCILEKLIDSIDFKNYKVLENLKGKKLANTFVGHVLDEFNPRSRQLIHSDHVDDEKGTGLVHIAPAHGEDDFALGKSANLNIEDLLDERGFFKENIPLVGNKSIKQAQEIVLEELHEQGKCLKIEKLEHSYPHSWRSKAPLIFRLTKQWFLKMDTLKRKALKAIDNSDLNWIPQEGKSRFIAMLSTREDWCISRQRVWGVPIAIFYNKETGDVLKDSDFLQKTLKKLQEVGVKNWWNLKISQIDDNYKDQEWCRVDDIVDIWFESGATQYFVLQKEGMFPADVYLEGSDQHRGWFQSSLLISAFQTGKAPWKNLVTHGFCLDAARKKMSKSLGNVINPASWVVDELRLFFASQNLCADVSLNENNVKHSKEMLFRFKNTIRFILGMLCIEEEKCYLNEEIAYEDLGVIEKWLLHRLHELSNQYEQVLKTMQVNGFVNALYEFCAQDLSAFYFDIRKDILYCKLQTNKERKQVMQCLQVVLDNLFRWLANITPFFAQEAWECYLDENNLNDLPKSVHLLQKIELQERYNNEDIFQLMIYLREVRKKITQTIEELREEKILTTQQEAHVILLQEDNNIQLSDKEFLNLMKTIAIVSKVEFGKEFQVFPFKGTKCARCRFVYERIDQECCECCLDVLRCLE